MLGGAESRGVNKLEAGQLLTLWELGHWVAWMQRLARDTLKACWVGC